MKNNSSDQNLDETSSLEPTIDSYDYNSKNLDNITNDQDHSDLPEEAQKILKRLECRSNNEVMNSEALRLVRIIWPKAFNVSSPQPLKIGIHKDMSTANILPDFIIPLALRFFTSMERYLEGIKPGIARIDLNGQAVGRVRLREAVDAEIKLYTRSKDAPLIRDRIIISKIRLLSISKK